MGANRDRLVNTLPWSLVEDIDWEHRHEPTSGGYQQPGIARLAQDCFAEPKNKTEAEVHRDLVAIGYIPLKKGWPDFFVFGPNDDLFLVEVKTWNDTVKPSQRVIHELLAARGIDVYVRWGSEGDERVMYEEIGNSKPWNERFVR